MSEKRLTLKNKPDISKLAKEFGLVAVVLVIITFMSFASSTFMTPTNITNILRQISINGVLAVGMTFVILTGGIDLSVGSLVAVTSVICGSLLESGMDTIVVIIIGVVASMVLGLFNGYLVSYVGFQPFIATLATMSICRGFAMVYSNGKPYIIKDKSFIFIGQGKIGQIPMLVIILVIVCILALILLETTTFGRYVFAIGGNKNAAKLSGVKTQKIEMLVYLISGLCCGIVGLMLSARISSGQPTAGEGYELDAIASVAIGGTSMNGGMGSLRGTILGFFIIGLISNSMTLLGIDSFYQNIVKGFIIILAVFLDMKTKGNKN